MIRHATWWAATALLGAATLAGGNPVSIASVDSFRVGSTGVLCTAQSRSDDPRFSSMFDRSYDLVCRDAATPVGRLYAFRASGDDAIARFESARGKGLQCGSDAVVALDGLDGVRKAECHNGETGLNYTRYVLRKGKTLYESEGLTAYDSALRLGLKSLVTDRPAAGEIAVATTEAGDAAAFAKVQAASLSPAQALAAGYDRNIEGSFVEAAQFFDSLIERAQGDQSGFERTAEYLANAAIQQSNLGNRAEAERLFAKAAGAAEVADPMFGRLFRNLKATHLLNNLEPDGALAVLETTLPPVGAASGSEARLHQGYIDQRLAQRLSREDEASAQLDGGASQLTENERATLLDAQATYLRGVALRLKDDNAGARAALGQAVAQFRSVRAGAVSTMAWLVAGADSELAIIAEEEGDLRAAAAHLTDALSLTRAGYPDSATTLAARARLAGLQARHGQAHEALETYRDLVRRAPRIAGGSDALRVLIGPYVDALVKEANPTAAEDFFLASQALVRPGVAQTQAVFARELSGGSDEASSLFRQSITLTREVVRTDVEISRLSAKEDRTPADFAALAELRNQRALIGRDQTTLLAKLAAFPRFRVASNGALQLSDLQANLRPGEAYYKLFFVDEASYAIFAEQGFAKIMKLGASRAELEAQTNTVRDSIVLEENNQLVTNPFDLAASHRLFATLFGPVADRIPDIRHLIFEPDGPLLKLPANVLVTDRASVDAYEERLNSDNPDEFDFTGVKWLGRERMVSTAVSARSFVDVRRLPPSRAKRLYLGLGENTQPAQMDYAPQSDEGRDPCDWALSTWNKPISSAELHLASSILGDANSEVIVGADYSDTTLRERQDLNDFRVVQFATHGLVTPPRPGCPARPALVTSFGRNDSDGLLSFKEIFDLRLDADTIILSACDTAGAATAAATREAGISTGGNFALDGLVRAFVGAGARTVVASHWPVPDDYDATRRLMTVMFEGGTRDALGEAMRQSQGKLMDDPLTSHPYYWAAFAIVGDASKPMTTGSDARVAAAADPEA